MPFRITARTILQLCEELVTLDSMAVHELV